MDFLIRLREENVIKHRKVGTHRRIRMEDVMACKAQIDQERDGVLDRLVEEAEDEDCGYQRP